MPNQQIKEINRKINQILHNSAERKFGSDSTWEELQQCKEECENKILNLKELFQQLEQKLEQKKIERQQKIDEFHALPPEEQERIKQEQRVKHREYQNRRRETIANMTEEERKEYEELQERKREHKKALKENRKHKQEMKEKYGTSNISELKEIERTTRLKMKTIKDAVDTSNMEVIIQEINNFNLSDVVSTSPELEKFNNIDPFSYIILTNRIDILTKLYELGIRPTSRHVLIAFKTKNMNVIVWMFSHQIFSDTKIILKLSERKRNIGMLNLMKRYGYVITYSDVEYAKSHNMNYVLNEINKVK